VLPLVVVPMIGITGMMLPRKSAKSPLGASVLILLQVVLLVQSALPTLTVVT